MGLAERLGMTLRELQVRMDSEEVSLWLARDRIEPPPDPWAMFGTLCALVANAFGDGKKAVAPADFMPRARRPKAAPAAGPEEIRARMEAVAAAFKARKGG